MTVLFNPQPDSWQVISCFYNREVPENTDTPWEPKGKLGTWTFFPLAEYYKNDSVEVYSYSDWINGDTIQNTVIKKYEEDGLPFVDSTIAKRRMMVYAKTVVFEEHTWRNGKPVQSYSPPSPMDKPTFLD